MERNRRWKITGARRLIAAFAALAVFSVSPAVAGDCAVDLVPDTEFYAAFDRCAEYLIDPSGALAAADLRTIADEFRPVATNHIDFGLTDARIWLRIELENRSGKPGVWRLDFNRQFMKSIDAYLATDAAAPAEVFSHNGDDRFDARPIKSTLLTQDIFVPDGGATLFIAYASTSTTYLPVGIGSPEAVVLRHASMDSINNFLNGALWAMIALALTMTPIVGARISLSFAFYIASGFLYVFTADGYAFRYLWPNSPGLNDRMNLALMLAMSAFALSFVRLLFDFHRTSPKFDRAVKTAAIVAGLFATASLFLTDFEWFMLAAYSFIPACAVLQAAAGVVAFRRKAAGSTPYLIGGLGVIASIGYATAAHLMPGRFNLDDTLDFGHLVLVLECFVFAAAVVMRVLQIRRQRDAATQAELSLAQEQLALSTRLREREIEYGRAQEAARKSNERLSAMSHDIQQPLVSLRAALSQFGSRDEASIAQMHAAFDYLENLARRQLHAGGGEAPSPMSEVENFDVSTVLDNIHAMFRREAKEKGIAFAYERFSAEVRTDPVALMRALSNLVANAVKHMRKGEVRLFAENVEEGVRIVVADTGPGMNGEALAAAMMPYSKGEGSTGAGLGLALVRETAGAFGFDFSIRSTPGAGTHCFLTVPRASL